MALEECCYHCAACGLVWCREDDDTCPACNPWWAHADPWLHGPPTHPDDPPAVAELINLQRPDRNRA